jgi:positive regulator of sigma E activity
MDRSTSFVSDCQALGHSNQLLQKKDVLILGVADGIARASVSVFSACASCHSKCLLSGERAERIVDLAIPKSMVLQPGDRVNVAVAPGFVRRASFLIYLLPALILLVFAYLGRISSIAIGLRDPNLGSLLAIFFAVPVIILVIALARKQLGGAENIHIIARSQEE